MKTTDNTTRICPRCGCAYRGRPAISREDNTTPICSDCGTREALITIGVSKEEQDKIISVIHQHTEGN